MKHIDLRIIIILNIFKIKEHTLPANYKQSVLFQTRLYKVKDNTDNDAFNNINIG